MKKNKEYMPKRICKIQNQYQKKINRKNYIVSSCYATVFFDDFVISFSYYHGKNNSTNQLNDFKYNRKIS